MATLADLKLTYRIFARNYPFGRYAVADNPLAKLAKPLSESRVALVTTAGLMLPGDKRFDRSLKGGDPTFRWIPNTSDVHGLIEDHKSDAFDHSGIEADNNLAFPLDRFRELVRDKKIGSLNERHLSFMGSIISPGRLIAETAPQAAELLKKDGVEAVFLTPV